ncbi:MAG: hypothetical protein Roseis2KO_17030 [Roseivirga sp.]
MLGVFALLAGVMLSCQPKMAPVNSVSLVGYTNAYASVKATGYGKLEEESRRDALANAMRTILFQGIPNAKTDIRNAIVDSKAREKSASFFDTFFRSEKYLEFFTSNQIASSNKERGMYSTVVDARLNINSLKKYLEAQGVIRGFGL